MKKKQVGLIVDELIASFLEAAVHLVQDRNDEYYECSLCYGYAPDNGQKQDVKHTPDCPWNVIVRLKDEVEKETEKEREEFEDYGYDEWG